MNIHKPKKNLQTDTLGSFIGQKQNPNYEMGAPKRQHFFSATKDDVENAIIMGAAENALESGLLGIGENYGASWIKEAEDREAYNARVSVLDEDYKKLEPNSKFIIRCFVFTGKDFMKADDSSLLIATSLSLPKVLISHERGKEFVKEYITDPYAYRGIGIIVAKPELELTYNVGDYVQFDDPETIAPFPGQNFVVPKFAYLSPESFNPEPPKDVNDKDFGYVALNRSQIILRYKKAE